MSDKNFTLLVGGIAAAAAALGAAFLIKGKGCCGGGIVGKPKLTYFNGRGLGELPRLVLAEAGVAFDDVRVDDIADLKPRLPFGQVPFYEEGDFKLSQSNTIARYIARQSGLYGNDARTAAKIDMIVDGINDIRAKGYAIRNAPEDKKEEEKKKFANEVLPQWTGYFEKIVKSSGGPWALGSEFTLADIALYNLFFSVKVDYPDVLKNSPTLTSLSQRVTERPKIAKYIKERPVSPW